MNDDLLPWEDTLIDIGGEGCLPRGNVGDSRNAIP
jgi:hypothetical protein